MKSSRKRRFTGSYVLDDIHMAVSEGRSSSIGSNRSEFEESVLLYILTIVDCIRVCQAN